MTKADKDILISLKKAQSSLAKVQEMIEGGSYCVKVMQQTLAAIGLLKSVNTKLMKRHLDSCFTTAVKGSNKQKVSDMIEEIIQVNKLANK
ncbi:MAG: metal-sensitive transcriptional regulator [Candidatus Komeilibacteria bacterium]